MNDGFYRKDLDSRLTKPSDTQNPCHWGRVLICEWTENLWEYQNRSKPKNVAMGLSIYWGKAFYVTIFKLNGSDG